VGTYRTAIGVVDGVNRTFFTPTPYFPGETRFLLNGQLLDASCITEVDPATGEVRWEDVQPPRVGDDLLLYYIDADEAQRDTVVEVVLPLHGILQRDQSLHAQLCRERLLQGVVVSAALLAGEVQRERKVSGVVQRDGVLSGTLTRDDC